MLYTYFIYLFDSVFFFLIFLFSVTIINIIYLIHHLHQLLIRIFYIIINYRDYY